MRNTVALMVVFLTGCTRDALPPGASQDMAVAADAAAPRDLWKMVEDFRRPPDLTAPWEPGDGGVFPVGDVIPGIWLVGWSGQIDHYSWMRFDPNGLVRVMDPMGGGGWASYFSCNGAGKWLVAGKPNTITVFMPGGCNATTFDLTLKSMWPQPGWGAQATFDVMLTTPMGTANILGYKWPDTQCAPDFSACTLPF